MQMQAATRIGTDWGAYVCKSLAPVMSGLLAELTSLTVSLYSMNKGLWWSAPTGFGFFENWGSDLSFRLITAYAGR